MVRERISEELISSGERLLLATDALGLQAQGAMWVFDHALQDWRFYLVTSLVGTVGRRKTYGLLLDVFEQIELPEEMTVEDVHLGSPSDPLFRLICQFFPIKGLARFIFENCMFNDALFDGVIYRADPDIPSTQDAIRIEKQFSKRVRELAHAR